jgi:hypothetical protein
MAHIREIERNQWKIKGPHRDDKRSSGILYGHRT